jgi:hypothetical protein
MFCDAEEEDLRNYLKRASAIYGGLSARELRQFVFEYAEGWRDKKMADTEWFTDHKTLSVLKPETAIINRAR